MPHTHVCVASFSSILEDFPFTGKFNNLIVFFCFNILGVFVSMLCAVCVGGWIVDGWLGLLGLLSLNSLIDRRTQLLPVIVMI